MSAIANNQIILEEIYEDPSEEEIFEYAQFLGIDPDKVNQFNQFQTIST